MFQRNPSTSGIGSRSSWASRALGLLSPAQMSCPVCGKACRSHHLNPGVPSGLPASFAAALCADCLGSVPWITHIECAVCGRAVRCDDCRRRQNGFLIRNRSAVRYDDPMKKLLALYKYRGKESLLPYLADMLSPAFEALSADLMQRSSQFRANPVTAPTANSHMAMKEVLANQAAFAKMAASAMMKAPFFSLSRFSGLWKSIRLPRQPAPEPVWDMFTFVPVSLERLEERGFNQAERFASALGERYRIPVVPLLERARHTGKQSFKTRSERLRDTSALFRALPDASSVLRKWTCSTSTEMPVFQYRPLRILIIDDIYTTGGTLHDCARALEEALPEKLELYSLTWARS
ncbi:ComF family protein [Paenibacillus beijingensis]|uniref:ComF family protein n=1 Tax=Paenibacillus beijingensis TaxID=1126833 RepID=UPI000697BED8|nr:ComF family protein [Paenibacillus beijingensis]